MHVKICGITRASDVELLAGLPVDHVGLWYGVTGGHADLTLPALVQLAAAAHRSGSLHPVLVTLSTDAEALGEAICRSGVRRVQLHGYQTPAMVPALKASVPGGVWVLKALHVRNGSPLERPSLIRAYEKAGVDAFLLDAVAEDGQVGSTGRSIDDDIVSSLSGRLTRPFFLAGGISARSCREHRSSLHHPGFLGIDVDTNARRPDGTLCPRRIEAISRAWTSCAGAGEPHVRPLH